MKKVFNKIPKIGAGTIMAKKPLNRNIKTIQTPKWERRGGMNWETETGIYTLPSSQLR